MRRVILAICATAVGLVLLLTFKTHSQTGVPGTSPAAALGTPTPGSAAGNGTGAASASAASGSAAPANSASAKSGTAKTVTVTGAAWPTIYGSVQVQITVKAGKIAAAAAVEYPTDTPRDQQINAFAIPQLNQEAVAASSAKIDTVSGATYTSGGYIGSLQNALDKAGIS
jgi:uncharacterized protein with FMN-binding domain